MGQIQSSINSMIGSAAIMAGLGANTQAFKDKKELRTLNKKIAAYDKSEESAQTEYNEASKNLMNEKLESGMSNEQYRARQEALKERRNEVAGVTAQKKADAYNRMFDLTGNENYLHQAKQQSDLARIRSPQAQAELSAKRSLEQAQAEKRAKKPKGPTQPGPQGPSDIPPMDVRGFKK